MGDRDEIKKSLERRLEKLTARTAKIEADLSRPGDRNWTERATERENQEVLERLDEAELAEVREIQTALARIETGTYGVCQECGAEIQEGRLEALPFANVCIDCAK